MRQTARKPGSAWYLLPVFLFVCTAILVPVGVVTALARKNSVAFQLTVPGQKDFEIRQPGKYVLWDETQTIYQGQTFSASNQLPAGIHIHLWDLKATNELAMLVGMNTTMTAGRMVRHSVGNFEISKRGKYRLMVEGQFPQRIFYFRESMFHEASIILAGAGIAALGMLASLVSAAVIFFKRRSLI